MACTSQVVDGHFGSSDRERKVRLRNLHGRGAWSRPVAESRLHTSIQVRSPARRSQDHTKSWQLKTSRSICQRIWNTISRRSCRSSLRQSRSHKLGQRFKKSGIQRVKVDPPTRFKQGSMTLFWDCWPMKEKNSRPRRSSRNKSSER